MRFRKTDTMLRRYLDRKVSNTGVFPTQHRLLMELDRNPSCSQVDLAEKFEVSAAGDCRFPEETGKRRIYHEACRRE